MELRHTLRNVTIDRPHRYRVGDIIRHVDSEPGRDLSRVAELTYRVVVTAHDTVMAFPTYTLEARDPHVGVEVIDDVLCTLDLVGAYERRAA